MAGMKPYVVASGLAAGTAAIGALLAFQAGETNYAYAFGLTALFAVAGLLFSKGEAEKKEAA